MTRSSITIEAGGHRYAISGMELYIEITKSEIPAPHTPVAADGQPSTPSDPDAGAKCDGGDAIVGRAEVPGEDRQGSQAVENHPSSLPAAALPAETTAADAADLLQAEVSAAPNRWANIRPHCRHPEDCAGYGTNHCSECRKAISSESSVGGVHVGNGLRKPVDAGASAFGAPAQSEAA